MSLTHLFLVTASATHLFFLLLCLYNRGKVVVGAWPSSQLECQKRAFFPLCTCTLVAAANNARSVLSTRRSKLDQGFSGFVHLYQSQRSRRALPNLSKSRIPRSPNEVGKQVVDQLTLHFPRGVSDPPPKGNDAYSCPIL